MTRGRTRSCSTTRGRYTLLSTSCVSCFLLLTSYSLLLNHAWQLANTLIANASCNCLSPKALLLPAGWHGAETFVRELKLAIGSIHQPPPYYPGLRTRFEAFTAAYPEAETILAPPSAAIAADAEARLGKPTGLLLVELDEEK